MTTLILDCDGVLADTERHGHLPAFNETFRHFGLPVRWSEAEYAEKLRIGGGKERMASLLTPAFIAEAGLPAQPEAQVDLLRQWHRHKSDVYTRMVVDGLLPARPGIRRIVTEALAARWRVAVASTSAEQSVRAVLEHAVGRDTAAAVAVFAGDIVPAKKPAPDIYLLALRETGADPRDTVVIEDSRNGLLAATGAGLATVVTVNGYTAAEDHREAVLVLTSLGDPDGDRTEVLASRGPVPAGGFVTLADLAACTPGATHPRDSTTRQDR